MIPVRHTRDDNVPKVLQNLLHGLAKLRRVQWECVGNLPRLYVGQHTVLAHPCQVIGDPVNHLVSGAPELFGRHIHIPHC